MILLLSNQLFDKKYYAGAKEVYLYEPASFYKINNRDVTATKKKYFKQCMQEYLEANPNIKHITNLEKIKDKQVVYFDPMDFAVEKELQIIKNKKMLDSPMFLLSSEDRKILSKKKSFTFFAFYKNCRKKLDIFPNPIGGKWSYDDDNRNKIPQSMKVTKIDEIYFPTNRSDALKYLAKFIRNKLDNFGKYQDAMHKDNLILWHAGISPMLNLGLLTPSDVIKLIPTKWGNNMSSYEGFLRQLFWREYMAVAYRCNFPIDNIFHSNKKLPESWYKLQNITGISYVDQKIKQAIKYGYLHHIERLMLIGNFLLLAQIKPIDVYEWFMVNFVDAHHWVMVGNVYHMLLWSSGLKITKRPYIASSVYINKMLTGGLTESESAIWDKIYAQFINKNRKILKHVYMMSGHLKRAKEIL